MAPSKGAMKDRRMAGVLAYRMVQLLDDRWMACVLASWWVGSLREK